MRKLIALTALVWIGALGWVWPAGSVPASVVTVSAHSDDDRLNDQLAAVLAAKGFTGTVESTLEERLGRRIDPKLADLGRLLWFDTRHWASPRQRLRRLPLADRTASATRSRSPSASRTTTSSGRAAPAPRNQRRTPMVVNTALLPGADVERAVLGAVAATRSTTRRASCSRRPRGHGSSRRTTRSSRTCCVAQAHIPPTERDRGGRLHRHGGTIGPRFDPFDDGLGRPVPPPDASGFRNEPIRQAVLARPERITRLSRSASATLFPRSRRGGPIDFTMFGRAIAEFEFTLTFADAPIDRFARGERARDDARRRSAARCSSSARPAASSATPSPGESNEMFSDFENHVDRRAADRARLRRRTTGNMIFDGPGDDEDFGLEQVTGDPADRYKFRTSPLRNVALQPAFFHNGAFTRLEDAIRHHLDVFDSARGYDPREAGVDRDLRMRLGPIEPVLARLDPLLRKPINLSRQELADLVEFVGDGLLDKRAKKENLCRLVPDSVPSGMPVLKFQGCQ